VGGVASAAIANLLRADEPRSTESKNTTRKIKAPERCEGRRSIHGRFLVVGSQD